MRVPFLHKKAPGKFVYWDVPEPLPPTYRIPFLNDLTFEEQPSLKPNLKIAEFRKGYLVRSSVNDEIREIAYCFERFVE